MREPAAKSPDEAVAMLAAKASRSEDEVRPLLWDGYPTVGAGPRYQVAFKFKDASGSGCSKVVRTYEQAVSFVTCALELEGASPVAGGGESRCPGSWA